jgi:hypothetical protein
MDPTRDGAVADAMESARPSYLDHGPEIDRRVLVCGDDDAPDQRDRLW